MKLCYTTFVYHEKAGISVVYIIFSRPVKNKMEVGNRSDGSGNSVPEEYLSADPRPGLSHSLRWRPKFGEREGTDASVLLEAGALRSMAADPARPDHITQRGKHQPVPFGAL